MNEIMWIIDKNLKIRGLIVKIKITLQNKLMEKF